MFSQSEIKAYKEIKAPDSLKEKLLTGNSIKSSHKKPVYKQLLTIAACVVLVFSVGFAGVKINIPSVYIGGSKLNGNEAHISQSDIMLARSFEKSNVIAINSVLNADISIENGTFNVLFENAEDNILSIKNYSAKGEINIQVNAEAGEKVVLIIKSPLHTEKITLIVEK